MGHNYYYVTSTGPVYAGQGINLHGAPQSVALPAPFQYGEMELASPVDGSSDEFGLNCEYAEINTDNDNPELQPYLSQTSSASEVYGMADSQYQSQTSSANDFYGMADSQYQVLQDEMNPEATWVEGPPEGATFGYLSGSEMVGFNGVFSESSNSEPVFDFPQVQTFAAADVQPEAAQIPNRDQRAQRRAELLAQMKQISQELIELEALDAA
ncbi:hypothetical protein KC340_g2307 [Hortaea werneckii]|nr:hypothetical protein KC342_g1012 [Hortaea werneckii]KAI7107047.1 hypothetical protein KC339_g2690 [Hortaea werneckii]KAI7213876.1 hypothetical protein KC365_g14117 [Hortaea werneckii]KAI7334856.1 hypothetical protein KC340_g2307 [Hortaea werneckii]KAI7378295.1 hypothetical protein KC328_g13966 [Hortaea werneckii]